MHYFLLGIIIFSNYLFLVQSPQGYNQLSKLAFNNSISSNDCKGLEKGPYDNFVFVKGGHFQMGGEDFLYDSSIHNVSLNSFYLSPYEVTFKEYDTFCNATGKRKANDGGYGRGNLPVIRVSWYDAIEYCNWRSQEDGFEPVYKINKEKKDSNNINYIDRFKWVVTPNWEANGYRLPTEAEWEYAARSRGKEEIYAGTSDEAQLFNFANFNNFLEEEIDGYEHTAPVGSFRPNSLGLYDMSGNVNEWCWDWYDEEYYNDKVYDNPKGAGSSSFRVIKGGSWAGTKAVQRCTFRGYVFPSIQYVIIGFRLCRNAQ